MPLYGAVAKFRYVQSYITTFYSQLGLQNTSWEHVNVATQIFIEFSHLHFGHTIPTLSESVLKSNKFYSSAKFKPMLSQAWNAVTQNKYRPSYIRNTYISNSATKNSMALKAVNVYAAGFELGVHGSTLGFHPELCILLRDVNEWIGICFSDTVDAATIEFLKKQCLNLIHRIQQKATLYASFQKKQTLTMWRDMCFINWWWLPIPQMYMTLKFETQNKKELFQIHESQNWKHNTVLLNAVDRNRLLKNAEFFQNNMRIPDEPPRYGPQTLKNADPKILHSNQILQGVLCITSHSLCSL